MLTLLVVSMLYEFSQALVYLVSLLSVSEK